MKQTAIFATVVSAALAVMSLGTAQSLPQGSAVHLAPHRAIYDMSLKHATTGSNISDVRGRLVFDFEGSRCAGYTLKSRLVTEVIDREGNAMLNDQRSTTWEDGAGDRFRFENRHYVGRRLSEKVAGHASRKANSTGIKVDLDSPREKQIHLQGKALFPTQHSLVILEAAMRGESIVQADVYDASEQGEKLFKTTTFIGTASRSEAQTDLEGPETGAGLAGLTSWPVSISYYEDIVNPASDEGLPTYELSFQLFANGISRDLLINYGDFLVRGKLRRLDFHKVDACVPGDR